MKNYVNNVRVKKVNCYKNDLGVLSYCNSFETDRYKRFYTITNTNTSVIRAWQGHPNEAKCFIPIKGKFLFCWIKIDDFNNPSAGLRPKSIILDSSKKKLIEIPGGYANGLKALEPNSEMMVFSEFNLEESLEDIVWFNHEKWFNWERYD